MSGPLSYSVNQVAERTGLSTDFIRKAIRATDPDMHLPARLAGTKYIVLADDLENWLKNLPEG